jgi:hypothetical protein
MGAGAKEAGPKRRLRAKTKTKTKEAKAKARKWKNGDLRAKAELGARLRLRPKNLEN